MPDLMMVDLAAGAVVVERAGRDRPLFVDALAGALAAAQGDPMVPAVLVETGDPVAAQEDLAEAADRAGMAALFTGPGDDLSGDGSLVAMLDQEASTGRPRSMAVVVEDAFGLDVQDVDRLVGIRGHLATGVLVLVR